MDVTAGGNSRLGNIRKALKQHRGAGILKVETWIWGGEVEAPGTKDLDECGELMV